MKRFAFAAIGLLAGSFPWIDHPGTMAARWSIHAYAEEGACHRTLPLGSVTYTVPCAYVSGTTDVPPYSLAARYPDFQLCGGDPHRDASFYDPFGARGADCLHLRVHANGHAMSNQERLANALSGSSMRTIPSPVLGLTVYEGGSGDYRIRQVISSTKHSLLFCQYAGGKWLCDDSIESDDGVRTGIFIDGAELANVDALERGVRELLVQFAQGRRS